MRCSVATAAAAQAVTKEGYGHDPPPVHQSSGYSERALHRVWRDRYRQLVSHGEALLAGSLPSRASTKCLTDAGTRGGGCRLKNKALRRLVPYPKPTRVP